MPSPFPGMDPFLEPPAIFPGFHNRFVIHLSEFIQNQLPEPYYAEIGERVWVETSQRFIEPDVDVLRPSQERFAEREQPQGGVAVAPPPVRTQPVAVHVPHDERRHVFVEVYTRRDDGERLVTVIEVLSRTNKIPGAHGRDLYVRKQSELLYGNTHLVEIDLLRSGQHTTAVPLDRALEKTGPFDYHVCIHRFDNLEYFFIYPIRLEERLPEIAIPLLPGDPDVPVDLQAVFDRCYDTGPYQRRVRYGEATPVPPLRPDQAEWANRLLRQKGILSA